MLASYVARLAITAARSLTAPKRGALEETRFPMRIWPTDIDLYGHLNNGRYLTLMDMGRWHYWACTGLARAAFENRWKPLVAAATIQFRRELRLLTKAELTTRLVGWDERSFFIEHRFEQAGKVATLAFIRGVVQQGSRKVAPVEMLAAVGVTGPSPAPSPELQRALPALAKVHAASGDPFAANTARMA